MKRPLMFIALLLINQLTYSQACGIYRIKYVGSIESGVKEEFSIFLPTTMLLHRVEKANSKHGYLEAKVSNGGRVEMEISSHLTTPFNEVFQLLNFYKNQHKSFNIKIRYSDNDATREHILKIPWDALNVTILEDDNFGTLFEFDLGVIKI